MNSPTQPRARASGAVEGSLLPLAVLGLGVFSVVLLLLTDQLRQRAVVDDLELLKAVGEIQRETAVSHLWLEEYVSGDSVDVLDIYESLDRSQSLINAMRAVAGPRSGHGPPALDDPSLLAAAALLATTLERFRAISFERQSGFEEGRPVGIGSSLDVEYDAVFRQLLGEAQGLEAALELRMGRRRESARLAFLGILLGWCGLVGLAVFGLWTRERRRLAAEAALLRSQEHLLQTQKMDAVGRLAGGLAHDLNNYLAAVRGHCELVRMKHPADEWIGRKMDAAIRVIGKASGLIERLQTFSRKQPLHVEVLNLNRVIESLRRVIAPSVADKVRLETRLAPDLGNIEIDPGQIEQLLVNLILNAQEAMPEGGTTTISTSNRPAPAGDGEEVVLEVGDTGHGIAPELKSKIFEPFLTTKSDDGRRGLGLSIVYGVVEQHGGRIELESDVGQGTTFRIYFPRSAAAETAGEEPVAVDAEELRGDETILLVDDNDEFRESARHLLEALGYHVLAADSGARAIELFEREREGIDLILSDVVMPGMSGPEAVARMRALQAVPVIFMSAYTDRITTRYGIDEGVPYFLKKLFSAKDLALRVREELDRNAAPLPGTAAGQPPDAR